MESFLSDLNDLIASAEDASAVELIGALKLTKQQLILDLFTDDNDTDDEVAA